MSCHCLSATVESWWSAALICRTFSAQNERLLAVKQIFGGVRLHRNAKWVGHCREMSDERGKINEQRKKRRLKQDKKSKKATQKKNLEVTRHYNSPPFVWTLLRSSINLAARCCLYKGHIQRSALCGVSSDTNDHNYRSGRNRETYLKQTELTKPVCIRTAFIVLSKCTNLHTQSRCVWERQWSLWVNAGPGGDA